MQQNTCNIHQYAQICEQNFRKQLSETNYKVEYTFYSDLSLAEAVGGVPDIIDTVNRVVKDWMGNIKAITEFVLSLNYKSWEMYHKGNQLLSQLYSRLYHRISTIVLDAYKDNSEALSYFYATLD